MKKMIQAAVLLHTDGGGQKVIGTELKADAAWKPDEAAPENFEVKEKHTAGTKPAGKAPDAAPGKIDGKTADASSGNIAGKPIDAGPGDIAEKPTGKAPDGKRVIGTELTDDTTLLIRLDANGPDAGTRDMSSMGPDAKATFIEPKLTVTYRPTGESITTTRAKDDLADRFETGTYYDEESGIGLNYNLFVPDGYDGSKMYPLVVFLHDAGTCSYDVRAALLQGNGAVSWASPEEQQKHPCFVLAPQFPEVIANDDFKVTKEADAAIGLIRHIAGKYRVDKNRIYGTGQSMGTMTLCELMLRNPGFFAACFLCAGQWDPERMAAAKDEHLWILISEKDEKAWPIMGACVQKMEEAGAKVARGGWSAADPIEKQEEAAAELLRGGWSADDPIEEQEKAAAKIVRGGPSAADPIEKQEEEAAKLAGKEANIYFTWFTGDSVKPPYMPEFPGVYHICTWQHTYQIQTIKDWVFRQRKR